MIITKLKGGLGNQLFQYAAGITLATQKKEALTVDTSFYKQVTGATPRQYLLHRLTTVLEQSESTDPYTGNYKKINEAYFNYNPFTISHTDKNIVLDGYWQSWKYHDYKILDLYLRFTNCYINSIAIHMRLGDYVNNKFHGISTSDYYLDALTLLRKKLVFTNIIIFTDDTENVKTVYAKFFEEIKYYDNLNYQIITSDSKAGSITDTISEFILMSMCRYIITANSTFSWWAAYYNYYKNKVIVMPSNWFGDENMNKRTDDLYLPNAIKIHNKLV